MALSDDLQDLAGRITAMLEDGADDPADVARVALELVDALAVVERRVSEVEAAQGLLLESATANLDFMNATNQRLDGLESR